MWTSKKKVAAASSSLSFPSNLEHKNNESGRRFFGRKSLTGQNKLRHVSEEDAGLGGEDASCSLSATPVSAACNNTNKCRGSRPGWMSAPALTPTPLPLPRVQHDGIRGGDGPQPSTGVFSDFGNLNIRKRSDHFAAASARHQSHQNGFSHVPNGAKDIRNLRVNIPSSSAPATGFSTPSRIRSLRVNIPSRSAPATGFSTPSHSPRQSSTWDFSPSSHSRCHSPIARTQRNSAFAMHNNSPAVCSPVWPEKANFHSLSLPPRETQSQSSSLHPLDTAGEFSVSQWRKGKLIGRGTYGSVYVATNRDTGALCAMKEVDIIPNDPKSAECIKQLEQEIKLLSQSEHPNIVKYFGSEIVDDHLYIFLEYVHPGSINRYIRDYCGAITESVVRSFTRHILTGLAYLHSTKTIHRDIKGANLLIDASGVVKLADFGVAKHLNEQACNLSLKGSPHWMAPELMLAVMQRDSNRDLAYAVDIWSLGCTIIEMLNGKPPWGELEGPQAMFKVLHKTPTIPEGLSREGKDFLQRCFQRNPADRPSASMLLEHPFLQKPHRISLQDKDKHSPEISGRPKIDQAGILQMGRDLKPERMPSSIAREAFQQCYAETSDPSASCHHYPHMIKSYLPSTDSPAHQAPIFTFECEQVLSLLPTRDQRFTTMDQPYRTRNRPEIGFHIIQ